ncbi:MAG: hypothetical protein JJU20_07075 [Opitutales bacterium]|nr:hypothetical protein [Opitutales bacterium]
MDIFPEQIQSYLDELSYLTEPPYIYLWTTIIVLLVVLYLIRSYRRSHRPIVPFKTEGGSIEIAPHTLRGIIQQSVLTVAGVQKVNCRHYVRGRSLKVKIAIHLQATARLKEVESEIKKQVRGILWEQFGMENIEPIDIKVVKLVGEPAIHRSETKTLELDDYEVEASIEEDLDRTDKSEPPRN